MHTLDDSRFENAMYELRKHLIYASQSSKRPVVDCLAELVKQCLISDDKDPHHVYSFDFIKRVERCIN